MSRAILANKTINYCTVNPDYCWLSDIHGKPNGTLFLLDGELCQISGNIETDLTWKFRRMHDCKIMGTPRVNRNGARPYGGNSVFNTGIIHE